ncbi:hypothetical protein B0A78_14075 [Flavobacterium columnare NBRC 100251 = ATCC 23463]|uniref:Uncharacterized protein n=2 Tax=Flavobacterium columnare TaxID=996 RepID=G8XBG2_FLACA|nr:hypothetical protein [Flavobacterium columnare]AEW86742.1 hypothetical protein FCOL_09665 [Flavobacterium columnare ATCC 49512]ANO47155.1 hypothetical protein Pf1_01698 [Flavobacterium columnare]APT22164.1 hypothetical protein BU993_05660 [Flavobacterium columnare]MEB3801610.1 hypothetical protein [Flavobacterium columnare]OOB82251.1 hypothetical protein BZL53_10570 [Flavobacterium columnare]
MKILYLTILTIILNISCKKKEIVMQNENINSENIVKEINKNIENYKEQPIYVMTCESNNCNYELFIDDIICHKVFNKSSVSSAVELNPFLFESKKIIIKYKLYPVKGEEYLADNSYLELALESYDAIKTNEEKKYYSHITPSSQIKVSDKYSEDNFVCSGKKNFQEEFSIDLKLPYKHKPVFSNGRDLSKINPDELKTKLIKSYQKVWDTYNNKDLDGIARLMYNSLNDLSINSYRNIDQIDKSWKNIISLVKNDTFEMQPLKDYKLEFFANGKLVALMSTNPDYRNRGNTALWAKVNQEGLRPFFINRYFYIPEGETEFKVY